VLIEIYDSFRKENEARAAALHAEQAAAAEGVDIELSAESGPSDFEQTEQSMPDAAAPGSAAI
jgi:hypothetical protein